MSPSSGRLDGGEQARLTLSATRDGLSEGDADARVELAWDGPARPVAVALRVEHPPEISGLAASPSQIFVAPCDRATTTLVGCDRDRRVGAVAGDPAMGRPVGPHDPAVRPLVRQARPHAQRRQRLLAGRRHRRPGNTASASGPPVRVLACP